MRAKDMNTIRPQLLEDQLSEGPIHDLVNRAIPKPDIEVIRYQLAEDIGSAAIGPVAPLPVIAELEIA